MIERFINQVIKNENLQGIIESKVITNESFDEQITLENQIAIFFSLIAVGVVASTDDLNNQFLIIESANSKTDYTKICKITDVGIIQLSSDFFSVHKTHFTVNSAIQTVFSDLKYSALYYYLVR